MRVVSLVKMIGWIALVTPAIYLVYRWRWFLLEQGLNLKSLVSRHESGVLINTGQAMKVTYSRLGKTYHLYVPYSRRHMVRTIGLKVYLIESSGKEVEITQEHGVPYLVTAQMLGGVGLKVLLNEKEISLGPTDLINLDRVLSD
jgi:hypothetical protein